MKQFILFLLILQVALFASCQNKNTDNITDSENKEYFLFRFGNIDYSYNGYEIGVGTAFSQIFPFSRDESGLMLYRVSSDYCDNLSDNIYILDSVKFLCPKKERIDSLDYYSIPVFDKEIPVNDFDDVVFHFKGFKQYNHEFEDLSFNQRTEDGVRKEFEFLYKEKTYQIKREFIHNYEYRFNDTMGSSHSITIEQGDRKQCIFKSMDESGDIIVKFRLIGDLDGDDNIDFIIYVDDNYGYNYFILYLSSEAEEGEIVKHVATSVVPLQRRNTSERRIYTLKGSTERIRP
ncbi:hypothetical protein [Dysgonomonas sp. 25]|uniref:hypothetical protein n=1 Tax=Dysgonomonas sp. 25 TaxID=2302933 RepID=UPI0013D0F84E|nr:hypothetical protein [Dysgonomonas sp. 25]NDV70011.1 hypothetical protein [Dysgonomonas sp. 25]